MCDLKISDKVKVHPRIILDEDLGVGVVAEIIDDWKVYVEFPNDPRDEKYPFDIDELVKV